MVTVINLKLIKIFIKLGSNPIFFLIKNNKNIYLLILMIIR